MCFRQEIIQNPEFHEFLQRVEQKLAEFLPAPDDVRSDLNEELKRLEGCCIGWRISLGDPQLDLSVRQMLQEDFKQAQQRINEIQHQLSTLASATQIRETLVDPERVAERLARLGEVLAGGAASAVNLELAQHLEGIHCYRDGRVVLRSCQLGALASPTDADTILGRTGVVAKEPCRRRQRTLRRTDEGLDDEEEVEIANHFAADPQRFAGLGPEWFSEEVLQVPIRQSWAEEHAVEVAQFRLETHATMEVTSKHFGKTVPTIREALRYARDSHRIDAYGKTISVPTRAFWPRDHAEEVAAFFQRPGATMKEAMAHFGKSQPWISKAKKFAREKESCQTMPSSTQPETPDSSVEPPESHGAI